MDVNNISCYLLAL